MTFELLPSNEFWNKLQIIPNNIPFIEDKQKHYETIVKYPSNQLRLIFKRVTNNEFSGNKDTLAFLITTEDSLDDLSRTLFILDKFSDLVIGTVLEGIAEAENFSEKKSKRGILVEMLVHRKDLFPKAIIKSLAHRKTIRHNFHLPISQIKFEIDKFLDQVKEKISESLSTDEKKASLDNPILENNLIILSIKHELGKRKLIEYDGWHFVNPAHRTIFELDTVAEIISLKGSTTKFAFNALEIIMQLISCTEVIEIEHEEIQFDLEDKIVMDEKKIEALESEDQNLYIVSRVCKKIVFSGLPFKGNPILTLQGGNLTDTVEDLKKKHELDLKKYDLIHTEMEIIYLYEGIKKRVKYITTYGDKQTAKFQGKISLKEDLLLHQKLKET